SRKKFVERHFVSHPVLVQEFFVVPENVPMMDASQHGIGFAILGHHVDEGIREDLVPSITLVQVINRFAVIGFYVLTKQLPTGMALPSGGRVTNRQTGLQNRPSSGATAARYGCVNNSSARIPFLVSVEQCVECRGLAAGGPPGKDLKL